MDSSRTPSLDSKDANRRIRHLCVAGLLFGVDMPYDIVRKTNYLVSCSLGHLCKTFGFSLVFKCVAWEIDAWERTKLASNQNAISHEQSLTGPVDISLHKNVDAANAIKLDFLVCVIPPIAHFSHVLAPRVVLFIACEKNPFVRNKFTPRET